MEKNFGFIVCIGVIVTYIVLITKAINIAKTASDKIGSYIAIGIARNIFISLYRKYRNDNGIIANNRSPITFYKLWGKFINYKCIMYRFINKYRTKKKKVNV